MIRELLENIGGYPAFFLLCAFSGTLVPLPEDVALLYGGMRIAQGEFSWFPALPIAMVGLLLRDLTSYTIGRLAGDFLLARPWGRRLFGGDARIRKAREFVERHGDKAVFFGRFIVGFRSPVFMIGGAMRLSRRRFVIWDSLGMCIAVPLMMFLGFALGEPVVEGFKMLLSRLQLLVPALGIALVAWMVWSWRNTDPSEGIDASDPRS